MNIASFDLNLLLVFDALMTERSVTRAASQVGLSQPALSNALARLREQVGDRLFVRGPKAMVPTPRALQLADSIRNGLHHLRVALREPAFDPSNASVSFRIAATDEIEVALFPALANRLHAASPGIALNCTRLQGIFRVPASELQSGNLDFAIGSFPDPAPLGSGLFADNLYNEHYVCIARKGHPLTRTRLTIAKFCAAAHVVTFYPGAGPGLIDRLLEQSGRRRRVMLSLPHWLSVPCVVAQSDLIATLPERVVREAMRSLGIVQMRCPVAIPPLQVTLVWHSRTHDSTAHIWLRNLVQQLSSALRRRG